MFYLCINLFFVIRYLLGRIKSVSGQVKQFVPRTKQPNGDECKPSEVDDWTALMVFFSFILLFIYFYFSLCSF